MKVENYGRDGLRAVRARIELSDNVFVNFNGQWEWYTHYRSGSSKGLERFMCYVNAPEHIAVLNLALRPVYYERVPYTREQEEREKLISAFFAPGMVEKRRLARMPLDGDGFFESWVTIRRFNDAEVW